MLWFTSDPHYWHKSIISMSKRPFRDLDHMHEEFIKRYNAVVGPNDTCIFVGDISFGSNSKTKSIISQLNGIKIAVMGNHDPNRETVINWGFQLAVQELHLRIGGKKVIVSHFPYKESLLKRLFAWFKWKYKYRYIDRRPRNEGNWLIHGHTHSKRKVDEKGKMIHVGVDAHNYTPVSLSRIESIIALGKWKHS